MPSMESTIGSRTVLLGDWRRRRGTKTDAHIYPERPRSGLWTEHPAADLPKCRKRIPRDETVPVPKGRPCYECLVAVITER